MKKITQFFGAMIVIIFSLMMVIIYSLMIVIIFSLMIVIIFSLMIIIIFSLEDCPGEPCSSRTTRGTWASVWQPGKGGDPMRHTIYPFNPRHRAKLPEQSLKAYNLTVKRQKKS